MGYYKPMQESSLKGSNRVKEAKIKKIFLNVSNILTIISIAIMLGEPYIAYCELFRDGPYRSLGPTLIVVFLIMVQFIGIILSLILKRWLKTRSLLNDKDRKLNLIPIRLLFFNIFLALVLALIVNISNGNITQLINNTK